jgi:subtilisin family serine protease
VLDSILRAFAILVMIGVIYGAGQMIFWLGSAWLPSSGISLAVQAFDVTRGDKAAKEEGKYLAATFVRKLDQIQKVMAADLTDLNEPNQVRFESVLPKSFILKPDVPAKIDITVKAFDVDVVGILETVYKFFDRSDRLSVTMSANEKIKVFASFKAANVDQEIGPWWLDDESNEKAAINKLAHQFCLDLYKTVVHGLDGLDSNSFATLVSTLDDYQRYVKGRHANDGTATLELLKSIKASLDSVAQQANSSALVYSYLGSVLSLQNDTDAAIAAYKKAKELNPADQFADKEIARLTTAKSLQPVRAAKVSAGSELEDIRAQHLVGYFPSTPPVGTQAIKVAVIGTGISQKLSSELGPRLVEALSVVPNQTSSDDDLGHGTAVASLVGALAPSAEIISIKCLSSNGSGTNDIIAAAIRKATERKANIILLPLGGALASSDIEGAVADAIKAGALVVAAAGNSSADAPTYPAAFPGVLAVGALDTSGERLTPFTNRGPQVLYAPGQDIRVLDLGGPAKQSGTSFSASIAAAIAAIIWAAKPSLSAKQVKELLESSSTQLRSASGAPGTGDIRRIDAVAALQAT